MEINNKLCKLRNIRLSREGLFQLYFI